MQIMNAKEIGGNKKITYLLGDSGSAGEAASRAESILSDL